MKKVNLYPYLSPNIKMYFRWIIDLNVKAETTELLEEKCRISS